MRSPPAKHSHRSRTTIGAILQRHPVFGALVSAQLKELGAYAMPRQVKAGTIIFSKGDAGTMLFAIARGSVKISAPARDGRETVFNVLNQGEIFGEIALLDGQPRTADASALSDCELLTIRRRDFLRFVESEPKVALKLIELLCARLRFASEHLEEIAFLSLPARLARTLLRLSQGGVGSVKNRKISITQLEIGQIAGMTREHANKHLRAWAKHQWVQLERGGIVVLAPEALTVIAALEDKAAPTSD